MNAATWLRRNALLVGLLLLSWLIPALVWEQVPDILPIHWNAVGEPDDFGPKALALLLMPGLLTFLNVLFWLIPVLDPKQNIAKFEGVLRLIQLMLTVFFLGLQILMVADALGYAVRMDLVVPIGVSCLFMVLGNYFGKLRPNYFVGIRTPWTLESPDNWNRTHRLAGKIWVGGALLLILLRLLVASTLYFWFFMAIVLLMSMVPIIYSFYLYKHSSPKP